MDPISILGLTTTAFSVVDRLAKTLKFLLQLSTKFKYADAKITLLIGYLGSLNAAIFEVAEIIKGLSGCLRYHRLAKSLETTLEYGRSVVDKITVIMQSAEFEDYVNGISRYVNALNLLLTALHSRSSLEQQGILNDPEAQDILAAMEDETSSLFCIADDRSILSRQTKATEETSAALSISFDFDNEILSPKIYAVAYRSHLRQAIALGKRVDPPLIRELQHLHIDNEDVESIRTVRPSMAQRKGGSPEGLSMQRKSEHKTGDRSTIDTNTADPPASANSTLKGSSLLVSNLEDGPGKEIKGRSWSALLERFPLRNRRLSASKRNDGNLSLHVPQNNREVKLLILGASESGKSTLLKSMKLFYEGLYTEEERKSFSEIIFSNIAASVRTILEAMETLELSLDDERNENHAWTISMQPSSIESEFMLLEVADAIKSLARDAGFLATLRRRREYHLGSNVDYYLDAIDRISASDYIPTDTDILHSRFKTIDVTKTSFTFKDGPHKEALTLKVYDLGGTRSQRRKWPGTFENVNMVLFTVDIASYDQILSEDESVNQMQEALTLWDSIVNSKWFVNTEFILCFTKQAQLATKLQHTPLKVYFPDLESKSPTNVSQATEYIVNRFKTLSEPHDARVHILKHPDLATDTDIQTIEDLARHAVKDSD